MSFGQGRFLEKRIKQKIIQEQADLRKQNQNRNYQHFEEELTLENMDDQMKLIELYETGNIPNNTFQYKKQEIANSNKYTSTQGNINDIVKQHCEDNWTNDNFSTRLLGIDVERHETGLSETNKRNQEMDE